VVSSAQLFEKLTFLKDAQGGNIPIFEPQLLSSPIVLLELLVPASGPLRDGTVEKVALAYPPFESDRIKDDLIKKFGASHPPTKKLDPKTYQEMTGQRIISREVWETGWDELFLGVSDKDVSVVATTSKLARFEQENKKDEF